MWKRNLKSAAKKQEILKSFIRLTIILDFGFFNKFNEENKHRIFLSGAYFFIKKKIIRKISF
jgi:hypothetical protein